MVLSRREIIFLTSVSHGRAPLGAEIILQPHEKELEYVEAITALLQERQILDDARQLTKDGVFLLTMWEHYRNAKKHVVINNTYHLAVLQDSKVMVLVPVDNDSYEFCIADSVTAMLPLLKQYSFLCEKDNEELKERWKDIDKDYWSDNADCIEQSMLLTEYIDGEKVSDKVFAVCKDYTYLINVTSMRIRRLSKGAMRRLIYGLIAD